MSGFYTEMIGLEKRYFEKYEELPNRIHIGETALKQLKLGDFFQSYEKLSDMEVIVEAGSGDIWIEKDDVLKWDYILPMIREHMDLHNEFYKSYWWSK